MAEVSSLLSKLQRNKKLTATEFAQIWNTYDVEGKGYINGTQLDNFLRQFLTASNRGRPVDDEQVKKLKLAVRRKKGAEIFEVKDLAELLPMEENFLLMFRLNNPLNSNVEFMAIWKKYDKDGNGSIDEDELKGFLKDLHRKAKNEDMDDKTLEEYANTILMLYDTNRDGSLQISEMAKLLPPEQNFLSQVGFHRIKSIKCEDIDRLFTKYDNDRSGAIESTELDGLLKDLMDLEKTKYTLNDLNELKQSILATVGGNRITKSDLTLVLKAVVDERKRAKKRTSFFRTIFGTKCGQEES